MISKREARLLVTEKLYRYPAEAVDQIIRAGEHAHHSEDYTAYLKDAIACLAMELKRVNNHSSDPPIHK